MPPAIIGGAIAAVGAVGSAVIGSKGASNAAKATTQAADTAANAQTQAYDKSAAALAPWQQQGLQANALLNSSLGIGGQPGPSQSFGLPSGEAGMYGQQIGYQQPYNEMGYTNDLFQNPGQIDNGPMMKIPNYYGPQTSQTPQNTVGVPAQTTGGPSPYANAFGNWLANSDYGFQFATGANTVNSGYAGSGVLQSGAAQKALEKYRQNLQKGYRSEYNALLGNQQGLGYGAASAQAGVSQNLGNNLANIAINQGDNLANAALVKASNTGQAINSLATIGAGIFGQSKYAKGY